MQDFPWGNHSSLTEFILLGFCSNTESNVILFSVFPFFYLIALPGNGLIITLIHTDSQLHTLYFFLSVLSVLDMGYVTTTVPQMLVHMVCQKKTIYIGCVAQMYIFLLLGITESWLFAIMAYDRYVAICHPLRYKVIMCGSMVAFCGFWCISCDLINTVSAMILPYCGPNEINHFFCEVPAVLKLACADTSLNDRVDFILSFILLLVPLSLIIIAYINIFAAILRIHSAQGRLKAYSTCASHITVVTMFSIPCMVMYMRPGSEAAPVEEKKLDLFYNVISAFLNSIIYSLRNKDVKRAFLKVTGWGKVPE
ncbi:LOW QUALITY PROTEIN: olfactory receptor 2A12-like [Dugong dugon]